MIQVTTGVINITRTITELGPWEVSLLAAIAGSGRRLFTTADAEKLSGNPGHARKALSKLEDKGWVERLASGRYMVIPLEAGRDRHWAEDSLAIGSFLAPDGGAAYWSAVRAWGWTTQLPSTVFLVTPRQVLNPSRYVLGVHYRFIRIRPEKLFGLTQIAEGALPIRLTDRERTVVDMMDRPDLCGGVAEVAAALREAWPQLDEAKLVRYVERHGSGTVPKRLGYLAERLGIPIADRTIAVFQTKKGKGVTSLDRAGRAIGPIVTRWSLRVNAVVPESTSLGLTDDS